MSKKSESDERRADTVVGSSVHPSIVRQWTELSELAGSFQTVYADPPWRYSNTASRGAAENHYKTMNIDELCGLPVRSLTTDDAHLHLWTTNAHLPDAFRVLAACSFIYKSCLVWVKPQLGMGNYWRVSHEFLLLDVRGRLPFRDKSQRSWVVCHRGRHSVKPYRVREMIESVSPGPYPEMFGRVELPRSEWTVFGNQVERRLF